MPEDKLSRSQTAPGPAGDANVHSSLVARQPSSFVFYLHGYIRSSSYNKGRRAKLEGSYCSSAARSHAPDKPVIVPLQNLTPHSPNPDKEEKSTRTCQHEHCMHELKKEREETRRRSESGGALDAAANKQPLRTGILC